MATDPFDGIERPISGEFVEIGQPTFAELIWAQQCVTSPAIGRSVPDVDTSLRQLAFGRKCVDRLRPPVAETGSFSVIPAVGGTPAQGFAYDVQKLDKGALYKQEVRSLGAAKGSTEFHSLVINSLEADTIRALADLDTGCPGPCDDPCAPGPDDVCAVDFAIILDDTGSMGSSIEAVKTGIREVAELLESTIGFNYRFSLVTFKDSVECDVPFDEKCGRESYSAFQAAINRVTASGGDGSPEYSAAAVKFSANGRCGCWRGGDVVRAMVLITDARNNEASGITASDAANAAAACNIKIAYSGVPGNASEGAIYADVTDGVSIRLASSGIGLAALLQTFIFSLCSEFIPDPECEGGTNITLNGTFEENINSWDTIGTVVWDGDYESPSSADPILRSLRLNKGAIASQTYNDLEPGSLALLNYNWCLRADPGGSGYTDYYYYIGINSIWRSKPDGSDLELFTATGLATSITYDSARGKIYWSERSNQTGVVTARSGIYSIGVDGTGLTTLYEYDDVYNDNATTIRGLVYDSTTDKIYYSFNDSISGVACIKSMQATGEAVDGSGHTTLANTVTNGEAVQLAIDETNRKLYWTANRVPDNATAVVFDAGEEPTDLSWIYAMDMDGSNLQIINKDHIKLRDIEIHGDTVYAVVRLASGWSLVSMDLDGSGIAGVTVPPTDDPDISGFGDKSGLYYDDVRDQFVITSPALGFAMKFKIGDAEGQIMAGPELQYFTDVVKAAGLSATFGEAQTIIGELRDSSGNPLEILEGSGETSYEAISGDCSLERELRSPVKVRVPLDGIIKAHFELVGEITPNTHWLNIDQVVVCILANADCGPGARNAITNGNFETGVQGWTDESGVALPETDPSVWDNDIFAIIVNLTSESEVRQRITELKPGKEYTLSFEVTSHEPDALSELQLIYGVLQDSGASLASDSATNSFIQPTPTTLSLSFTAPDDGIVKIYFKVGSPGGVAKIRNVLVCDLSGVCEAGYERVSYDEFETNKGSWSGGVYTPLDQRVNINYENPSITQTFPGLTPGSTFQLSTDATIGGILINLISDDAVGQLITPTTPGYYTTEVVVQDSGIVVASISILDPEDTTSSVFLDDVLTCVSLPEPCDGSVSDMQVLIEWNGIARQPVNLFNAIVRYTIRDRDDPFNITEETFISTTEGRLSISACNLWKSQIATSTVLRSSLSNIGEIDDGDFASVAARTDWIWSIPQNNPASVQDSLTVNFPDPGSGRLVESVQVLFLANNAIPAIGTDTPPVYPAPLACTPDPASEFNIIIRFTNSEGLSREFSTPFSKSDLWVQEADFSSGSPWDTDSATGNGIKGSSARWESVQFDLDTVDGRGLDQCTEPLFYRGTGTGDLEFKKFSLSGSGWFFDPCDSEVTVEDVGVNPQQRVTVIRASAGSWTLTVTVEGEDHTTTPIPWNTTAEGLQAQLTALEPFEDGEVVVQDLPKTLAEQNLRVRVTFAPEFGELPLMVPDFQTTLLCDPIVLTPVDPGPYPYPLPNCDEVDDDLNCSSGPLLCRPGPGDDPIVLDPCCDEDTIPDNVNVSVRIKFERDLFDPRGERTIRDLALIKGLSPANYTPYIRDFNTGRLTETSWDVIVVTKMSILLIENELDTTNGRRRVTNHIANHREILPARFVWPNCDLSYSDLAAECWPGVSGS